MPLPKPKAGEEKIDFISRCVANEEIMDEFDTPEQRVAVCNDLWGAKEMVIALERLNKSIKSLHGE